MVRRFFNSQAFTLIELLVVIAIIALLSSMLLVGANLVRTAAKVSITKSRMQEVQRAMNALGNAQSLHQGLAAQGMSGVVTFTRNLTSQVFTPAEGAWFTWPYPTWVQPSPWGSKPTDDFTGGALPTALPADGVALVPPTYSLVNFNPDFTNTFFQLIGSSDITPAPFFTDRSPTRAWNDAWGNPLVIAISFFQPPENTGVPTTTYYAASKTNIVQPDLFIRRANAAYGFSRAFYLSVGASGRNCPAGLIAGYANPSNTPATWTAPAGLYQQTWDWIAQTVGAAAWTSAGGTDPFAVPPWKSVKLEKGALMSEPVELQ